MALLPGLAQALPYHSYVEGSASYTTDQGVDTLYETASGSGVSEVLVNSFPQGQVSWGEAHTYSNPAAGVLKARAYGAYFYSDGNPDGEFPFGWDVCFFNYCYTLAPETLSGAGALTYARSVWQVTSSTLPRGTPVSLTLNISLQGRLSGDPLEDGRARADLRAWLNTPAALHHLSGVDPLNDAAYDAGILPGILNFWQDVGPFPNLWISVDNLWMRGDYSESMSKSSDDQPPFANPPLPQVTVGDLLVLEMELAADTYVFNDGCCRYVTADNVYIPVWVSADFFNTANVGLTVNTAGVQLVPVPEPRAVWTMLAGLGVLILGHRVRSRLS